MNQGSSHKETDIVLRQLHQTLDMPNFIEFCTEVKELNPFKFSQILDFHFAEISHNFLRSISLHFIMTTDRNLD